MRTVMSILFLCSQPEGAVLGAFAGLVEPRIGKIACENADLLISRLWHSTTFNQKVCILGVGLLLVYFNFRIITIPTTLISAKYGAEFAIENYHLKNQRNIPKQNSKEHNNETDRLISHRISSAASKFHTAFRAFLR